MTKTVLITGAAKRVGAAMAQRFANDGWHVIIHYGGSRDEAQAFLAHSRSPHGRRVIQVTDQKLENSNPDFFSYTMSKHALDATIKMLGKSAPRGEDRVYGLAPGAILASHDQSEEETEISHRLNPLQRKTGANEIADTALFLASGALRSGETIFVDSGQHMLDQPRDVIYLAREQAANA